MNAKYTTGQWAVRDLEIIGPINSNKSICEITGNFMDESEAKANAKLIAAAPELLKRLSDIIGSIDDELGAFKGFDKNSLYYTLAKEAIKKATN